MKHKHHIIPKHMGGSDHESNLIDLTVEEHAEAHLRLYEEHGKIEDYLAWRGLSGQIGKSEILAEIYRNNGKRTGQMNKGKPAWNKGSITPDHVKEKLRKPKASTHNMKKPKQNKENMGKYVRSPETKHKLSELAKMQFDSEEKRRLHGEKIKATTSKCIHCGLESVPGNINRWHNNNCKFKDH